MGIRLVLQSATLLTIVLSVMGAQTPSPVRSLDAGCKIIDDTRPPVQLSFAVSQEEFKRRGLVGLTLNNNTTCSLFIPSDSSDKAVNRPVLYEIQDPRRSLAPTHRNHWVDSDLAFFKELQPGKSLDVGVEKAHAARRLTISVRFLFSWETDGAPTGDFEHRVYFASSNWSGTGT